jgi:hypothetical protein
VPGLILLPDWTTMWRDRERELRFAERRNRLIATVEAAARMNAGGVMSSIVFQTAPIGEALDAYTAALARE